MVELAGMALSMAVVLVLVLLGLLLVSLMTLTSLAGMAIAIIRQNHLIKRAV